MNNQNYSRQSTYYRTSLNIQAHQQSFDTLYSYTKQNNSSGKIMEKIILEGIEKHLKDNRVICNSQHSFMKAQSYLPKLLPCTTRWPLQLMEENKLM